MNIVDKYQWITLRILNIDKYRNSIINIALSITVDDMCNKILIWCIIDKINIIFNFEGILEMHIWMKILSIKIKKY